MDTPIPIRDAVAIWVLVSIVFIPVAFLIGFALGKMVGEKQI